MLDGVQSIDGLEAIITDKDDVGFYDPANGRVIILEDAAVVRKVVDEDIAERLQYGE